jgi:Tfp pilus assembly protein PilP
MGWKSKIIMKRATAYISINKLVVDGCGLEKGQELHSYLAEDENERKIMIVYLDGKKGYKQI